MASKAKKKKASPVTPPATPPGSPRYELDRREAVPRLIGDHEDFLIVTGLAGTAKDIGHLSNDGAHTFTMAGAMGAAAAGAGRSRRERLQAAWAADSKRSSGRKDSSRRIQPSKSSPMAMRGWIVGLGRFCRASRAAFASPPRRCWR